MPHGGRELRIPGMGRGESDVLAAGVQKVRRGAGPERPPEQHLAWKHRGEGRNGLLSSNRHGKVTLSLGTGKDSLKGPRSESGKHSASWGWVGTASRQADHLDCPLSIHPSIHISSTPSVASHSSVHSYSSIHWPIHYTELPRLSIPSIYLFQSIHSIHLLSICRVLTSFIHPSACFTYPSIRGRPLIHPCPFHLISVSSQHPLLVSLQTSIP